MRLPPVPIENDFSNYYSWKEALVTWERTAARLSDESTVDLPSIPVENDFDSYFTWKEALGAWERISRR